MGHAVASLTARERRTDVDFALIGHLESWRAAADVLAVRSAVQLADEIALEIQIGHTAGHDRSPSVAS